MAVKFKFAMKNSSKNNGKKTMERTGRKKSLERWSLAGFKLVTTGLRVRVLTVWTKRHLVVSEAKMDF